MCDRDSRFSKGCIYLAPCRFGIWICNVLNKGRQLASFEDARDFSFALNTSVDPATAYPADFSLSTYYIAAKQQLLCEIVATKRLESWECGLWYLLPANV